MKAFEVAGAWSEAKCQCHLYGSVENIAAELADPVLVASQDT